MRKILFVCFCAVATVWTVSAESITVTSPDSKISLDVNIGESLTYAVSFNEKMLIFPSPMGFEFKGEEPMSVDYSLVEPSSIGLHTDTWDPIVKNKHAHISLLYNEAVFRIRENKGDRRRMDITARVYNDGVAFRYTLYPSSVPGDRKITKELTQFRLPEGSSAWIGHNAGGSFPGPQESPFVKTPVSEMTPDEVDLLPLLVEVDKDNYIALTEAFVSDFPGWFAAASDGAVITRLAPLHGEEDDGVKARFSEAMDTPWRVIMVADHPGRFIESEMIRSLNPPCAIENPEWITPGMMAWDNWWTDDVKMEMPVIKRYIDFASRQGWPYMLIDWQWYGPFDEPEADITREAPQLDMREILSYAKERGVRIWLWLYATDVSLNDAYKEAFALYESWGVAGVKIDFMDRDDQEMVNWYRKIVKCAAEHHLMVNFHGAYRPDGIDRTWPNLVTREGVMGNEYSKWSDDITPSHNITLAFTRMLAGAMDYTPGGFINVAQGQHKAGSPAQVMNTRCAELSKFVIYESPQCCFCDHPDNVLGQSGADFTGIVPTVWDDIHFISGYPGDHIAIAKRSGTDWYLGVMNNETARDMTIDMSFLPEGKYSIEYWADGKKADKEASQCVHKCGTYDGRPLKIHLAAGGGYVAVIKALCER